jgi:prepilin-type N-terminal cleavage/methylation domain-containing protein
MLLRIKSKMIKWGKDQRGFTLVELIVVMAILVLLGTLAVPQFRMVLADAREDANTTNLNMLQNAVDIYISAEGLDPAEVDDFQPIKARRIFKR